jgi:hypothetical protein
MIYFISNGTYTKIGKADDPYKRIKELQTGCPETLEIKLIIEGDEEKERVLHKALNKYRIRGEWFHLNFEYNENLIKEIIYFHKKLNKTKPKRVLANTRIKSFIDNFKNEKIFLTMNVVSDGCSVSRSTVEKYFKDFKEDIDKHNISNFNTDNYNAFIKSYNIDIIESAIKSLKNELDIKLTKRKVAKKSELHINTVYNLWLEDDVQEALEEYNKWVKQFKK